MNASRIEEVLEAHRATLLALPGVVGVAQGICDGAPCIRVFVTNAVAAERAQVPRRINEFPVRIELGSPYRTRGDAP